MADFERDVEPLLGRLRRSVIHNDANDYNVIVGGGDDFYSRDQSVVGIIDFGDLVHSWTVADLAIAIAYAILDKPDPLPAAAHVVRGYHAEHPLTETELAALFGLVRMRLCVSVCLAALQQRQRPDDPYLTISQAPIRNTLPRLAAIHSRFAEAAFREACGLAAVPKAGPLTTWLRSRQKEFAPVLGIDLTSEPCLVFDFSPGSPFFEGDPEKFSEPDMTARLFRRMAKAGARVGVGRYDEPRLIYSEAMFADGEDPGRRTPHSAYRARLVRTGGHSGVCTAAGHCSYGDDQSRPSGLRRRGDSGACDTDRARILHAVRTPEPRCSRRA